MLSAKGESETLPEIRHFRGENTTEVDQNARGAVKKRRWTHVMGPFFHRIARRRSLGHRESF